MGLAFLLNSPFTLHVNLHIKLCIIQLFLFRPLLDSATSNLATAPDASPVYAYKYSHQGETVTIADIYGLKEWQIIVKVNILS